jgi:transposase
MPNSPSYWLVLQEMAMSKVIIGVDPHKLSATIEVVDRHGRLLGTGRVSTDQAGYAAMRTYVKAWPDRVWAVEGSNGAGRPLAQRLLEAGEEVVDVPAKLAARVRLFDTGHNRKTDARDAHSVAIVAVRTKTLRVLRADGELEAMRMLCDRREELTRLRVQTVNRLQCLLAELVPGHAKKDLTALQAKAILAKVRPRDIAGKTRRRIAAEELADLVAVEAKMKKSTAELKAMVKARGSRLMELPGVGPVVAARTLADVGDVARFADRNRFASWTGTAPLDASSGEQNRHRLSRAGNRRMNLMMHIAAISQIRLDTPGRAYYRRSGPPGRPSSKRSAASNAGSPTRCTASSSPTPNQQLARAREGTAGRHFNPARSTRTRPSTLRISHFPDPQPRRYNRHRSPGRARRRGHPRRRLTTKGSRSDARGVAPSPGGVTHLGGGGTAEDSGRRLHRDGIAGRRWVQGGHSRVQARLRSGVRVAPTSRGPGGATWSRPAARRTCGRSRRRLSRGGSPRPCGQSAGRGSWQSRLVT